MAESIAQIASKRLIVFDSGTPANNLIYTASDNVAVQSLWVTNKGSQANELGTTDMSSGYAFGSTSKSFKIKVNGTSQVTVTLDTTTTNVATTVSHINEQLRAASANSSVTPDTYDLQNPLIEAYGSGNYVGLRSVNHGGSFVLEDVDALVAVLGISVTNPNKDGVDVIRWNLVKVVSGGTIGTPAQERDVFTNREISARKGPISVAVGTVLTAGEKLYAWVDGESATVDNLVCLESSGTSGVA